MIVIRRIAASIVALCALVAHTAPVWAAAEVHRLSLMLSSNPTQLVARDVNDLLDDYNRIVLESRGLQGISKVTFAWYHQAELRYFVRPNVAVSAGFGQLRTMASREFLPRIGQRIQHRIEVLSVPVHVGAAYYLAPYNQGDFQARAYLGGGFMNYTSNKTVFERMEFNTDSVTSLGSPSSFRLKGDRDGPGYYLEVGAHMFFAVRYSVMLGAIYRSAKIRNVAQTFETLDRRTGQVVARETLEAAETFSVDLGGLGARMALGIGF